MRNAFPCSCAAGRRQPKENLLPRQASGKYAGTGWSQAGADCHPRLPARMFDAGHADDDLRAETGSCSRRCVGDSQRGVLPLGAELPPPIKNPLAMHRLTLRFADARLEKEICAKFTQSTFPMSMFVVGFLLAQHIAITVWRPIRAPCISPLHAARFTTQTTSSVSSWQWLPLGQSTSPSASCSLPCGGLFIIMIHPVHMRATNGCG